MLLQLSVISIPLEVTQQEKYSGSVPPRNYWKLYIQKYMTGNRA